MDPVLQEFVDQVRNVVGADKSAVLAIRERDQKIVDLINGQVASGGISEEAANVILAGLSDLGTANGELAAAIAENPGHVGDVAGLPRAGTPPPGEARP